MDYVYICRDGENEELRYSIRSVEKHLPRGRIWVVGGKPDWYTGNHIPVKQEDSKYNNAIENIRAACESNRIGTTIVLMNDDFFAIKPLEDVPTYVGGFMVEKVALYSAIAPRSTYTKRLLRTSTRLSKAGIDFSRDYELHVPMVMNKGKLLSVINAYPDCLWRSMYGNIYKVGGLYITDVKYYVRDAMKVKSHDYKSGLYPFVSSEDDSFQTLKKDLLNEMFSEPSSCEGSPKKSKSLPSVWF
jgi:hypothetical protein